MGTWNTGQETDYDNQTDAKSRILFNDIVITPETGTPQGGFYPHFLQM